MTSSPTESPAKVIRFGLFELDIANSELRRNGLRLKLQDQPLHLLQVLVEHPGTLISRDELRQRLWTPDTFVEFDHSLNTAMTRLREALGDSRENPRFIQTVPRKGYRFIAPVHGDDAEHTSGPHAAASLPAVLLPVSPAAADPAPAPAATPVAALAANALQSATPSRAPWGRLAARLAVAVVSLAMIALLARYWLARTAAGPGKQFNSIAVLPMQNLSGDPNQEYFADGMTDQLIASLARIHSLRVISRTTAMEYKGTHRSLEQIAHDLNVDAIVEGTVLRSGDRVRITAELVEVATDRHLWADSYESPMGDILLLQNQVASAIASQIRIKLTPEDKEHLAESKAVNAEAFEDYLKGRYYWGKRSEDGLDKAIQYFRAATEKDPNYALAYAGLADCYGILGAAIVGTVPTREVAPLAETAASRAVQLDPTLAETQTALATVEFNYQWNWEAAETGFRRAIELNPGYATAHQRYSLYLIAMGRTAESLAEMDRARVLDPLSLSVNFSLGWRLYMAGQYDRAIAQLLNTIEMDPNYLLAHIVLGQSYEAKGMYPEAIAELEKADVLSPNSPPVASALGHAYARAGRRAEALRMLGQMSAESGHRYVSPFYPALVYAGLGDRARTLAALGKAVDDRSNNMIFLNALPQFDSLRDDPAFQSLLRRVGLAAHAG